MTRRRQPTYRASASSSVSRSGRPGSDSPAMTTSVPSTSAASQAGEWPAAGRQAPSGWVGPARPALRARPAVVPAAARRSLRRSAAPGRHPRASSSLTIADRSPASARSSPVDCSSLMVSSSTAALTRCRSAAESAPGRPTARNARRRNRSRPVAGSRCRRRQGKPSSPLRDGRAASRSPAPAPPTASGDVRRVTRQRCTRPASSQHHPAAHLLRQQPHQLIRSRRRESGLGQRLLRGESPCHSGVFVRGDGVGDGAADRDERRLHAAPRAPAAPTAGRRQQLGRHLGVAEPGAESEADHPGRPQPFHVPGGPSSGAPAVSAPNARPVVSSSSPPVRNGVGSSSSLTCTQVTARAASGPEVCNSSLRSGHGYEVPQRQRHGSPIGPMLPLCTYWAA